MDSLPFYSKFMTLCKNKRKSCKWFNQQISNFYVVLEFCNTQEEILFKEYCKFLEKTGRPCILLGIKSQECTILFG